MITPDGQFTLGVDIGTYETKGVLVDEYGAIHAQGPRARTQNAGATAGLGQSNCPEEDWLGAIFVFVCQTILRGRWR